MREKKFPKPFDLCHGIMFNGAPERYTYLIGALGIYVEKINRRVHLKDGTCGEMDSAYIADPDYELLFERVAVDLEHMSIPVRQPKMDKIGDYDVQLNAEHHLPTLITIASHVPKEKSVTLLVRSPSDITMPYFLDLGEEKIDEKLNNARKKINNNDEDFDALDLGVIAEYAPRHRACEIMGEVIELYVQIVDDLDFNTNLILYSVFIILIDAYFDDEEEYRRYMNMLENNTKKEVIESFSPFEGFRESLEYANERISELEAENSRISELEAENSELVAENSRISELEAENSELVAKIVMLENQLNSK